MQLKFSNYSRILITGGAGFIGSNLIVKLLKETSLKIFNIDKIGYASDITAINQCLKSLGTSAKDRYTLLKVDLSDFDKTKNALQIADPDLIINLAAESHVDNSIRSPKIFVESNVIGTFNLLQLSLELYKKFNISKKNIFRFLHVSTDEVFGSLGDDGLFSENSKYDPRSPYSASKAASDHFVKAWFHTYQFPTLITNCGNNFGPWQYKEKLIPIIISKALSQEKIPIYGNGLNIRDWIFVDDHINALLLVLLKGKIGDSYTIGSEQERTNLQVVNSICSILDTIRPFGKKYNSLIEFVDDRPGHDNRYGINPSKIKDELGWESKFNFNEALESTVIWYLKNINWLNN